MPDISFGQPREAHILLYAALTAEWPLYMEVQEKEWVSKLAPLLSLAKGMWSTVTVWPLTLQATMESFMFLSSMAFVLSNTVQQASVVCTLRIGAASLSICHAVTVMHSSCLAAACEQVFACVAQDIKNY
jgi:hypothetical protein